MLNGIHLRQAFIRRRQLFFLLCLLAVGLGVGTLGSSFAIAYQADADKAGADPPNEPGKAPGEENEAEPAPGKAGEPAQKDSTDEAVGDKENFLIVLARANGWFFGPLLLLLSFVMVALIMMSAMQVRRDVLLPQSFVEAFEQHLTNKDYQGAYETAKSDDSFVARVLEAGLRKLNRGYNEAIEGMQEVGEDENMALEHRISYLALIGSIAPMIGLMGTVWGMIGAFEEIATSVSQPKPKDLAANIQTALITTLEGLMIAIPAMVAYSILRNRVSRYVLEVGMISESFMSRFAVPGKPPQARA